MRQSPGLHGVFPWASLFVQGAWLGWEAQQVIWLRLACLAAGGPRAHAESSRMVTEKIVALADAQWMMFGAALKGQQDLGARGALRMYRRVVRANRLRLTK